MSGRYQAADLQGLPLPVQRYFRHALAEGQPRIAAVRLAHRGRFNLSERGSLWRPFRSEQQVSTQPPSFEWRATIRLLPGVPIRVRDAYAERRGHLTAKLFNRWPLADQHSATEGDELARGELMRYLAEAAWYPTALLPGLGVRWQAVDDTSADATLHDGTIAVTLRFHFGADGLIERVGTEARGRSVGGRPVMTPWEGRWSGPAQRGGMWVPLEGEVAWITPQGRKPYWRGTLEHLAHDFAA